MTAIVHALANQKGGVGKSSTAYGLARALSVRGRRVLAVDFDPQGNLSSALAAEPLPADQVTVADIINPDPRSATGTATHTAADVIVATVFKRVDLIPARVELAGVEATLAGLTGREHRLREALADVLDRYDDVIIDCPPSLGQLTINALAAADDVVIVTEAEQWSADGMAELRRTIARAQRYLNPGLTYAGVIVNKYRPNTRLHAAGVADIERYFTEAPVWTPYIHQTVTIPEAIAAGVGIDEHGSPTAARVGEAFDAYAAALIRSQS